MKDHSRLVRSALSNRPDDKNTLQARARDGTYLSVEKNGAAHLISKQRSGVAQKQVDALDDVNVHFVLLVADPLASPVDGSGDLRRELGWFWFVLGTYVSPEVDIKSKNINRRVLMERKGLEAGVREEMLA
jgi:hypothetical protein